MTSLTRFVSIGFDPAQSEFAASPDSHSAGISECGHMASTFLPVLSDNATLVFADCRYGSLQTPAKREGKLQLQLSKTQADP